MKKISFILTLVFLLIGYASAKEVSQEQARKVAAGFVSSVSSLRSTAALTLAYEAYGDETGLRQSSYPLLYVYNVGTNNGFVIVAGDDVSSPILGYSDKDSFSAEEMPENLRSWLAFYQEEIVNAIGKGFNPDARVKQHWMRLLNGSYAYADETKLLQTANWDQLVPYNKMAPMDGDKRSASGCVATAMGIVMKYHKWPERATGDISYTTEKKGFEISATLGVRYDWDNMLTDYKVDNFNHPLYTEAEGEAVAQLIYDCGIAVEMDYSSKSSGALSYRVLWALLDNFDYDDGAYLAQRDIYKADEWYDLIREEIAEDRPVLYSGVTIRQNGHYFVIDGYDADNFFHVNWGWSGHMNGYFLLSALDPDGQGTGGNEEGLGYNYEQDAIIGMQRPQEYSSPSRQLIYYPNKKPDAPLGLYTNEGTVIEQDVPFMLHFSEIVETGFLEFDGNIALFHLNKDHDLKETLFQTSGNIPRMGYIGTKAGIEVTITEPIEPGDVLAMFYSVDQANWLLIHGSEKAVTLFPLMEDPVSVEQVLPLPFVELSAQTLEHDVTIRTNMGAQLQRVRFVDMSGRVVKDIRVSDTGNEIFTILLTDLKAGIYILQAQTDKGTFMFKIMKR